jgi:hypothetical protein
MATLHNLFEMLFHFLSLGSYCLLKFPEQGGYELRHRFIVSSQLCDGDCHSVTFYGCEGEGANILFHSLEALAKANKPLSGVLDSGASSLIILDIINHIPIGSLGDNQLAVWTRCFTRYRHFFQDIHYLTLNLRADDLQSLTGKFGLKVIVLDSTLYSINFPKNLRAKGLLNNLK